MERSVPRAPARLALAAHQDVGPLLRRDLGAGELPTAAGGPAAEVRLGRARSGRARAGRAHGCRQGRDMTDETRKKKFPGSGLAKGLGVTLKSMTAPSVTQEYPHQRPDLPPRSRGVIGLLEENCTVCMLCARECPDWCIYIDSHKETQAPASEGARPRVRNVLDRFAIDYALCMYCGICIEVCPFDALFWSPEFEYATHDLLGLTHEREELREWTWTLPPPPPDTTNAEPAKEVSGRAGAERLRPDAASPSEDPDADGTPPWPVRTSCSACSVWSRW